ncbi:[NiFe]-hydrogenase assembly chaperone HybE [Azospirillum sp. RWY-5-1]|uniref:[NiFe]-hydrogenase assembly chaperone HybE n=1 Tax=Azospirillum oleiclasticum TaxID=2735135 RepID=A0ABX2TBU7_9PROT|nr:[NiFe]-hydrogenase assembly chaperone HybE [Azospirillum oleiclasticum]NYZ14170.1 [NiFe]-hydrogenase assembly chaperone HybE [Azospirillum oleiclasticum]NYZ21654.1 [NiFe]-hydrogenase assembly chaperone HybE [Azospirillum oleiclasticum]
MTGGLDGRVAALVAEYRRIAATDMVGVPICNPALAVEAVGFRPFGPGWLGAVVTPWFLNAVLIPADPARWALRLDGDREVVPLPAGDHAFTAARLDGLGTLLVIPLVSAMNVFTSHAEAVAAAGFAVDRLMTAPEPATNAPPPARAETVSRRALFGRGPR